MKLWILCACLLLCDAGFGQEPTGKLAFEVESIKPADAQPMGRVSVRMSSDAAMLRYTNVSLKDCIGVAYGVKDFQVEGPDWIAGARFDIVAKLPAGSSKEQIPEMLQAMLADRFKLTLHRDTKDHAIYALVVGKGGPKLKPASPDGSVAQDGNPGRGELPRGGMAMQVNAGGAHMRASAVTLATLAERISRFSERPVVDMTGIQGEYDFDLTFSPETMAGMPGPPPGQAEHTGPEAPGDGAASFVDSVQPYGLKLEPRKAPMEVLTVDHIEKAPTEN